MKRLNGARSSKESTVNGRNYQNLKKRLVIVVPNLSSLGIAGVLLK